MKRRQARPAGARTDIEGRPSARIATVTCYIQALVSISIGEGKVKTYPDEGDGIEEALYEEGISRDA